MREQNQTQVTPEDVGLAACGDLGALRRLRDHWLELATGEALNPLSPIEDILPQLELLAQMAATGIDQPEDWIVLMVVYQIRVEALERLASAFEGLAKQAAQAENEDHLVGSINSALEYRERLKDYRAKNEAILAHILNSNEAHGTAMLVSAMTHLADSGDERGVPILERLMASVTPERAKAIQLEVRKMEEATLQ